MSADSRAYLAEAAADARKGLSDEEFAERYALFLETKLSTPPAPERDDENGMADVVESMHWLMFEVWNSGYDTGATDTWKLVF